MQSGSPGSFSGRVGEDDKSAVEWHSFRTPDDHSKLDVQDSGVQTRKKSPSPGNFSAWPHWLPRNPRAIRPPGMCHSHVSFNLLATAALWASVN
jgi:hypothetical protein